MRPTHDYTQHSTWDLTECKVHCLKDEATGKRRIVAMVPKTWEKKERQDLLAASGHTVSMCAYLITEWEEILLWTE